MEKNTFKYKTKQRAHIIEYLKQNINNHITAETIIEYFKNVNIAIGKSTVYRCLDSLVQENIIRKYATAERESACFQYIDNSEECNNHYHMKCIKCGSLIHLDCDEIQELQQHILKEHNFKLDICKTVLYGICKACMEQERI